MTTPDHADDAYASVSAPTETLNSAYAEIVAIIDADPDRERAYRRATELAQHLREKADDLAHTRAIIATEIFEADEMTLSKLAQIIGVSKQRASQLIMAGKRVLRR